MKTSGTCIYDYRPGSRDALVCVTHKSEHTIIRMKALGHDVLLDLFALGKLVGDAKKEAEKLAAASVTDEKVLPPRIRANA